MSEEKSNTEIVIERLFGKLRDVFADTVGEVVAAIAKDSKLDKPEPPKLGVVQGGAGATDPNAKTDPPPAAETPTEAPTNVRQILRTT